MAMIAARALDRNRERAARLVALLAEDLDAATPDTGAPVPATRATARDEAVTLAHQIAGSAGTFGYDAASDDARTAMDLLADGAAAGEVAPFAASVRSLLDGPPG